MRKILITGFMHSGTTMLMQLIRNHPDVGWVDDETGYIEFDKSKKWIVQMASKKVPDLKNLAWGEKIPWETRKEDFHAKRPIRFSRKWLKTFGKDARVLHIIRHPIDSSRSGSWKKDPEQTFKFALSSLPKYIAFINKDKRCATIKYEELVTEPEKKIKSILEFLNLRSEPKIIKKIMNSELKFGKINPDRAYAHLKNPPEYKVDYEKIIKGVKKLL